MRKLLATLFLLLIAFFGVIGINNATDSVSEESIQIEQTQ